jgi:cyclopropane-fatty-acyl-phospholipid synthase
MQPRRRGVADELREALSLLFGEDPPVALVFWDGTRFGPHDPQAVVIVRSPVALRRILWAPGELGLARAYVAGELDVEGDIFAILALRDRLADLRTRTLATRVGPNGIIGLSRTIVRLAGIGLPPPVPAEEVRLRGLRHSKARDAAAISHHYDISNDFYGLVLGDTMTYSCAAFLEEDFDLSDAQHAKHELVARKLGLKPGMRLLDVGCGWGSMLLHAARHHGVEGVGITLSREQAGFAKARIERAGLSKRIEIRVQDYRDVADGPYDAISSIGMFEHVGLDRLRAYFTTLRGLLPDGGRLLNHAIGRPRPTGRRTGFERRSFVERYVFPDGELHEVGNVISAMASCGLEVRDLECLREHYGRTLRAWVANLERNWDDAVRYVGASRARVWRLYMAGSALAFEANRIRVDQVLAVRTSASGKATMPPSRSALLGLEPMAVPRDGRANGDGTPRKPWPAEAAPTS